MGGRWKMETWYHVTKFSVTFRSPFFAKEKLRFSKLIRNNNFTLFYLIIS